MALLEYARGVRLEARCPRAQPCCFTGTGPSPIVSTSALPGHNMSNAPPLSLQELERHIATVRENIRQLIEQAAASSAGRRRSQCRSYRTTERGAGTADEGTRHAAQGNEAQIKRSLSRKEQRFSNVTVTGLTAPFAVNSSFSSRSKHPACGGSGYGMGHQQTVFERKRTPPDGLGAAPPGKARTREPCTASAATAAKAQAKAAVTDGIHTISRIGLVIGVLLVTLFIGLITGSIVYRLVDSANSELTTIDDFTALANVIITAELQR